MKKIFIFTVLSLGIYASCFGVAAIQTSNSMIFYDGRTKTAVWDYKDDGTVEKEGAVINGDIKVYAGAGKYRMFTTLKIKSNEIRDGAYKWQYKTGEPAGVQVYKDGRLNGEFEYFYKNGGVSRTGSYRNGRKHGDFIWYYKTGEPAQKGSCKNGERTGEYKTFYKGGQIKEEFGYVNGKRHGKYREYYETGALKTEGRFVNGEKDGAFINYFESGEEKGVSMYENGVRASGEKKGGEEEFIPYMPIE